MKQCPKCQASVSDTAKFCMECGFHIKKYEEEQAKPKVRFCPECGTEIPRGSFCPECGYHIDSEQAVSSTPDTFDDTWLSDLEKDIGAEVERIKEQKSEIQKEENPAPSADEEYIRKNFKIKDTILKEYLGNEKEVVIPDFITCISIRAFADCKSVSKIIIPDSVIRILQGAFINCTNLTSVTFSNSLKSIPSGAFSGCAELKSVTLPDSVKKIGYSAFYGCTKLSSVTLSKNAKFDSDSFPTNTKIIRK